MKNTENLNLFLFLISGSNKGKYIFFNPVIQIVKQMNLQNLDFTIGIITGLPGKKNECKTFKRWVYVFIIITLQF